MFLKSVYCIFLIFILCNCSATSIKPSDFEPIRITTLTPKYTTIPPTPVIRILVSNSWVKKHGVKIMDFGIKHLKPEFAYGQFDDEMLNRAVNMAIGKGFLKLPDFKGNASAFFTGKFIPTIICIERGNLKKIVSNVDIKLRSDLFQIFRGVLDICLAFPVTVKTPKKYWK
jgi:hypothetical protein